MKLFQYWDTGSPPADVAGWIAGVRADNPEFEHLLFDERSAAVFIAEHYGPRETAAFQSCAVPAMQADYFRLCALNACGGVYVDADCQSQRPLAGLLAAAPEALILVLDDYLHTAVMMSRRPDNRFFRAYQDLATDILEQRRFDHTLLATGSYIADALRALVDAPWFERAYAQGDDWCRGLHFGDLLDLVKSEAPATPELAAAFQAITLTTVEAARPWIRSRRAAYKASDRDWRRWKGSIYKTPPLPRAGLIR